MDATATLERTETAVLAAEAAAPSRRAIVRLPKSARGKKRPDAKLHTRYRSANFKRMEAAARVRAPHKRNASRFLVASGIFHALLVVGLGTVLLAQHVESDRAPVIITDVTFYEAPPQVEIVRQPELLLASEIREEALELPAEKKADEDPVASPTSEIADAASVAPGPQLDEEPSATAEIIHSVETDFSRVKYRGSARGVGNASEDRGTQAVVARSPAAAPAPSAAVGGAGGSSGAASSGVTRSAAPLSLSIGTYPKRALKERREGMVELKVEVLASGRVGKVELYLSSGHADLDETALNAAKGWRFSPAQSAEGPVDSTIIVPVRYQVKDAR